MSEITLAITGMTCTHCARAVNQALAQVPGVNKVEVNLDRGLAVIHGAAEVSALVLAVTNEGYHAVAK
jgi:copper chaperone